MTFFAIFFFAMAEYQDSDAWFTKNIAYNSNMKIVKFSSRKDNKFVPMFEDQFEQGDKPS